MIMSADKVVILATGPSASSVRNDDLYHIKSYKDVRIIAVNGALDYFNKHSLTDFFTLDASIDNLNRINRCPINISCHFAAIEGKTYCINNPYVSLYKRVINEQGTDRNKAMHGLAENPNEIHTGNSAYGALGLAYHWKPKKILLLGVDANDGPRINDNKPSDRSLNHLPELFASAVSQLEANNIKVVNGSLESSIDCFPKCSALQGLSWVSM